MSDSELIVAGSDEAKHRIEEFKELGHEYRYRGTYYAAFVIGPDGHNVEAVCHEPEA